MAIEMNWDLCKYGCNVKSINSIKNTFFFPKQTEDSQPARFEVVLVLVAFTFFCATGGSGRQIIIIRV